MNRQKQTPNFGRSVNCILYQMWYNLYCQEGLRSSPMKIILTLEIKPSAPSKKKSPAPQKPATQSNSPKNTVIINQK